MIFLESKFLVVGPWVFDIVALANDVANFGIALISTIGKVIVHVPQNPSKKSHIDMFNDNLYNELFKNEVIM
jgi:hypothetical protein